MKALSIRAPWWWLTLYAGKTIENRSWQAHYRGPVLIHASKWWRRDEFESDLFASVEMWERVDPWRILNLPGSYEYVRKLGGHIVGKARIVGCVTSSDSPWFTGPYGFVLEDVRPLATPVPFKGQLGLFNVPDSLVERAAVKGAA